MAASWFSQARQPCYEAVAMERANDHVSDDRLAKILAIREASVAGDAVGHPVRWSNVEVIWTGVRQDPLGDEVPNAAAEHVESYTGFPTIAAAVADGNERLRRHAEREASVLLRRAR